MEIAQSHTQSSILSVQCGVVLDCIRAAVLVTVQIDEHNYSKSEAICKINAGPETPDPNQDNENQTLLEIFFCKQKKKSEQVDFFSGM